MFLLMPFIIWMFDTSVVHEFSYEKFTCHCSLRASVLPGMVIKLVALGLIWATCTTVLWRAPPADGHDHAQVSKAARQVVRHHHAGPCPAADPAAGAKLFGLF